MRMEDNGNEQTLNNNQQNYGENGIYKDFTNFLSETQKVKAGLDHGFEV